MNINSTEKALANNGKYRYFAIFEGILVGLIGGLVVSLYRYLLAFLFNMSKGLYARVDTVPKMCLMFAVLIVLGLIAGWMVKTEPMISGSGIPQVEGVLLGKMRFKWLRVLTLKFLGGLICLGSGMSLGREGPSVQIGSAVGLGISRNLKADKTRERYLLTFGAAAGLAAAFNAPFAGTIFVLEELHKNFDKNLFIGSILTGITADMVSKMIFGTEPVFTFGDVTTIPYSAMYFVVLLGLLLGLLAVAFNRCILFGANNYGRFIRLPDIAKPVPAFILTGIIALTLPELLGGGHELVDSLPDKHYTLAVLLVFLAVKFLFTQFCFASKSPGGIFLPLLSIGGLCGAAFTAFFVGYSNIDPECMGFFVALSLAGFFGAVTKAPITGIILVCEMTGSFNQFLFLAVVCIVSYMVTEFFNCGPIYEMLLHNTLEKSRGKKEDRGNRIVLDIPVELSSHVRGKTIKDLKLPESLLIISIKRGDEEIVPKGDVMLHSGDEVVALLYEKDVMEAEEYFSKPKK
ncbi:MAG: ClC family H(+)/Cl(-) exchange transporter [Eubacterium sp.]|nr:ClC family H(+)/Cl(-) exchange transporter [Eubacterium sp.]